MRGPASIEREKREGKKPGGKAAERLRQFASSRGLDQGGLEEGEKVLPKTNQMKRGKAKGKTKAKT